MGTEAEGFPPEDRYVELSSLMSATAGPDRTADLEAQVAMFRDRAGTAEAAVMRLELDLARKRDEIAIADDALRTAEADLDQAARLVPDPDEVVVRRDDAALLATIIEDERPAVRVAVERVLLALYLKAAEPQ